MGDEAWQVQSLFLFHAKVIANDVITSIVLQIKHKITSNQEKIKILSCF